MRQPGMTRRPSLVCVLGLVLVIAPAVLAAQARVIDVPNTRPRAGTPGRFDTLMLRPNAAPDSATETATVTDVVVGGAGHFLAVDARGRRLIVFDSSGRLQAVLGRAGAGPGEYRFPYLAAVTEDGAFVVLDETLARLTLYDRELRFERTIALPGHLNASSMIVIGSEIFVAGTLMLQAAEGKAIHVLSLEGEYLRSFGRLVETASPSVRRSIGGGVLSPARNGGIWFSQLAPYLIERYARDGTLELQIRRANDFLPSAEPAFHVVMSESRTVHIAPTPFARAVAIQEFADGSVYDQTVLPSAEIVTDLFKPNRDGSYRLYASTIHGGPILLRRGPNGTFVGLVREDWSLSSGIMWFRFTPAR